MSEHDRVLDDIWTDTGGVSLRIVAVERGPKTTDLRVELTDGVGGKTTHSVTLTGYRAHRLGQVLAKAFPK